MVIETKALVNRVPPGVLGMSLEISHFELTQAPLLNNYDIVFLTVF